VGILLGKEASNVLPCNILFSSASVVVRKIFPRCCEHLRGSSSEGSSDDQKQKPALHHILSLLWSAPAVDRMLLRNLLCLMLAARNASPPDSQM